MKSNIRIESGKWMVSTLAGLFILLCAGLPLGGLSAAEPAGSTPIAVTTEKLTVTVKQLSALSPTQRVEVRTDKLTVSVKNLQPLSATQPVVVTTEKMTVTIKK